MNCWSGVIGPQEVTARNIADIARICAVFLIYVCRGATIPTAEDSSCRLYRLERACARGRGQNPKPVKIFFGEKLQPGAAKRGLGAAVCNSVLEGENFAKNRC